MAINDPTPRHDKVSLLCLTPMIPLVHGLTGVAGGWRTQTHFDNERREEANSRATVRVTVAAGSVVAVGDAAFAVIVALAFVDGDGGQEMCVCEIGEGSRSSDVGAGCWLSVRVRVRVKVKVSVG